MASWLDSHRGLLLALPLLGLAACPGDGPWARWGEFATIHESARDMGITRRAVERGDPALCETLSDRFAERRCYGRVAPATGRVEICERIPAGVSRDTCVHDVARARHDASLCDRMANRDRGILCAVWIEPAPANRERCVEIVSASYRAGCYRHVAYTFRDESWCRKLEVPAGRAACLAQLEVRADTSDPCNRFEHLVERKACYTRRAVEESNPSLCDRVGASNLEMSCYGDAIGPYVARATESADWDACRDPRVGRRGAECIVRLSAALGTAKRCRDRPFGDGVDFRLRPHDVDRCLERVADGTGAHGLCERIADPALRETCVVDTATTIEQCGAAGRWRDGCLENVSRRERDPAVCARVVEPTRRRDCYEVARRHGYGSCEDVTDDDLRDECHLERAIAERSPERCDPLSATEARAICRALADPDATDASACQKVAPEGRDGCITHLAMALGDPALCAGIRDADTAAWCRVFAAAHR
jgi:hypothetical protein